VLVRRSELRRFIHFVAVPCDTLKIRAAFAYVSPCLTIHRNRTRFGVVFGTRAILH
jgi:hypothetical protein